MLHAPNYDMEAIASRIRKLRVKNGYCQKRVASVLDITQSNYACIESAKIEIKLSYLYKLADFYSMEITEFFTDNATPPPLSC